jgi:hypothetical protein
MCGHTHTYSTHSTGSTAVHLLSFLYGSLSGPNYNYNTECVFVGPVVFIFRGCVCILICKTMSSGNQFQPTRVVVLAELPTREKEKYYQMLLSNKARYHRDEKGRYVASIRLLAPGVKKEVEVKKITGVNKGDSVPLEDRLGRLQNEFVTVKIAGVEEFDYSIYNRFSLLIAMNGDVVKPKPQSLFWLMKKIESLYDSRFIHEKMDVERDDISLGENASISSIFPVFIVKRFSTEKGLIKTIVDQNCWDLLYNVHVYRHDYLEVEIFARFLQEFYDNDDLLFYLYVRSVISKVLNVSFKSRWGKADGPARQPKGLWMSYRECVQVARIVFGIQNETMWRRFLEIINPQMVGQKTELADSRRIDITQFLHLAVVGYHQTVPAGSHNPTDNNPTGSQLIRNSGPTSYPGMMDPSDAGTGEDDYGRSEQAHAYAWNDNVNGNHNNMQFDQRDAALYGGSGRLGSTNHMDSRDGLLESKEAPRDGDDGDYNYGDNSNLGLEGDDYGSSLDAYLAALSADETGQPMPVEMLSGAQRRLDVPVPPPLPNQQHVQYAAEEDPDYSEVDEYGDPLPNTGNMNDNSLSPGAAMAVAAAMKAANVAGDQVRRNSHNQGQGVGIQGLGRDQQAFYSVTAPLLPAQPRLEQPNTRPGPPKQTLPHDNTYLNEHGQWQEYDTEHPSSGADSKKPAVSLSDIAAPGYTPATSAPASRNSSINDPVNQQSVRFQASSSNQRPEADDSYDAANRNARLQSFDEFGVETKVEVADEDVSSPRASTAHANPNSRSGLLQSYQSGYGFNDDELQALKAQQAKDEEAEELRHAAAAASSSRDEAEDLDQFASLQLEREREFLSFVCSPLADLPEQIAEGMVDELATTLRTKVRD